MSFETKDTEENQHSDWKELVRNAANINSQLNVWQGKFDSLRAKVSADKQAELDIKRAQFVNQLKTTLGL